MFWKGMGVVFAFVGLCTVAAFGLNAHYGNLEQIKANELKNCTYGGSGDRILAIQYVEKKEKVSQDFRSCMTGNGNGNVRLCENAAYKLNGLKPLNENDYGDKILMDVIANVDQCGGK